MLCFFCCSDFERFFDPNYGNCYIFNSGWDGDVSLKKSRRAGRRHGMKFILNVNQDEYVEEMSQGAGARVVIHAQERMPFPSDEGILTTPGQVTSIGMRQVLSADKKINRHSNVYNTQHHLWQR